MPKSKAVREAEAIKKLDESALLAQERIMQAADKAQKMIDDACTAATAALEVSSRVPDKRNLNGSFQWDRGDRYRRGSDDRIARLEDVIDTLNKAKGKLEIGQAKREEQIVGLLADCINIKEDLNRLRNGADTDIEQLKTEFSNMSKELTDRTTTLRELVLEIRDAANTDRAEMRSEFLEQKAKQQSNLQWKIISAVSAIAFLFLLVTITLVTHTFGGLP